MRTGRKNNPFKTIWCMANIAIAIATFVSAHGGTVDPEISPIPAILAMTFPLWLLLCIAAMISDLFIPAIRKQALIPGVSLLACIGPLLTYSPLHFASPKVSDPTDQGDSFTLLSYNVLALHDIYRDTVASDPAVWKPEIARGARNPTASYLISSNADIMCLQEFRGLAECGPMYYTKEQVDSLDRRYPHYAKQNGEDILSRYPLKRVELRQPDSPYAWFGAAIADIQGHETLVVSIHLQSIGLNESDKELYHNLTKGDVESRHQMGQVKRQLLGKLAYAFKERAKQVRLLRQQIDSIGIENVIVAGDFNDIPGCFALRELCRDDFTNAFAEAGFGPEVTYHANRFYFHIDHIVYRGAMRAIAYERGTCPNSDHYPIMARFVWDED